MIKFSKRQKNRTVSRQQRERARETHRQIERQHTSRERERERERERAVRFSVPLSGRERGVLRRQESTGRKGVLELG